ncbi:MAG: OmpA family protein [Acidobacteria bacterium]|nr:OmpA family protein [Acidobacteriota bacterium]
MLRTKKLTWLILACLLVAFAAGCKKKVPPAPPPPPPPPPTSQPAPPAKPVVGTFSAEPSSIQRGQSSTLRWNVSGADSVSIDNGIGVVSASGTRSVSPSSSTTYTLTARSAGGSVTSTARVTVSEPPPPPPPPVVKPPTASLDDRLRNEVGDIYFDYDKYDVREDARSVLSRNSDALKRILADFPSATISVEGHCDERGSAEYNLGLGDRRSTSAKEFLTQLGVSGDRLRTISFGKEKPQCTDANEDCWQKNRRVHFSAGQ